MSAPLQLGRMSLDAPLIFQEQLGDPITNTGGAVVPGDRAPLKAQVGLATFFSDSTADTLANRQRVRRQIRALLNNTPYKLSGLYLINSADGEQNGWYVPDQGLLADGDGASGVATGFWKMDNIPWSLAGHRRTHRAATSVYMKDRRLSTTPRDVLRQVYSTDFAGLTALALTPIPSGVTDPIQTVAGTKAALTALPAGYGGSQVYIAAGLADLSAVSFEQAEAQIGLGDVIAYDRRGGPDYMTRATVPASVEQDLQGYTLTGPAYTAAVLADSPVSYFKLDETTGTAAAAQVGATTGTYNGTVTLGGASGVAEGGTSVAFNGSTGRVDLSAIPTSVTNNWALECMVKLGTASSQKAMFIQNGDGTGGYGVGIGDGAGGTGKKLIGLISSLAWVDSGYTFTDLNWHHVVMTRESGTTKFYVDGVQTGTTSATAPNAPANATAFATRTDPASLTTYRLNGSLDECAIYATALTSTRVAAHAAAVSVATVTHTGTGGETTFTVSAATFAQSSAWSSAGSKSGRLTVSGTTAPLTTLDSPSFAVQAGENTTPFIYCKVNTITGGNVPLTIHWSDGTSSAPFATLTGASPTGAYYLAGGITVPAGVTSYTIRAAPSVAGTYDIAFDIPLGVPGTPTLTQALTYNGVLGGDPQTDLGWEEIYGPDYPFTAGDIPVLANSLCRVRYKPPLAPVTISTFAVDVWDGSQYVEQERVVIYRNGDTPGYLDTLLSAQVVEYTPERTVVLAIMQASADTANSRERVYITLKRAQTGPRFEVYFAPVAAGTACPGSIAAYIGAVDTNDSAIKIDTGAALKNTSTAGSGSTAFATAALGSATFTGENEVAILREGGAYSLNTAVLAVATAASTGSDSTAYGIAHNYILFAQITGYSSLRISHSPQVAQQILEAEAMTLGTGTTVVTDAGSSGGSVAQAARTSDANAHVTQATWPNSKKAKYRVMVRARATTASDDIRIYAKTGATTGATRSGAMPNTYAWYDLGDITSDGGTLEIHAWNATAGRNFNIDRIEAVLVEDRLTAGSYLGARDTGQAELYDSRAIATVVTRST